MLFCSCCTANSAVVPSCTNPLTQTRNLNQNDLCPRLPYLSISDVRSNSSGRVESENVFIDELLLRKGNEMDPVVYVRNIQAGFVLSYQDPPYSVCGCSDINYFTQEYIDELSKCTTVSGVQVYALKEDSVFSNKFHWLSRDCDEYIGSEVANFSGSGDSVFNENENYVVDGTSANLLQLLACSNGSLCARESDQEGPAAEFYPDQTQKISVTIFYNNNVRIMLIDDAC